MVPVLRVVRTWQEAVVAVQRQQLLAVAGLQRKIENGHILADARRRDALRHHGDAPVEQVTQRHLRRALLVLRGERQHHRVAEEVREIP